MKGILAIYNYGAQGAHGAIGRLQHIILMAFQFISTLYFSYSRAITVPLFFFCRKFHL